MTWARAGATTGRSSGRCTSRFASDPRLGGFPPKSRCICVDINRLSRCLYNTSSFSRSQGRPETFATCAAGGDRSAWSRFARGRSPRSVASAFRDGLRPRPLLRPRPSQRRLVVCPTGPAGRRPSRDCAPDRSARNGTDSEDGRYWTGRRRERRRPGRGGNVGSGTYRVCVGK